MSFFEEIPGPELEMRETNRQPEWAAPPENVVGATVPSYTTEYWLWPLPAEGSIRVA